MIKSYVCRAMQVSMLEAHQLIDLHDREKTKGYVFPNWDIQAIFGLGTIKDRYGIPADDPIAQNTHNKRIADEIDRMQIRQGINFYPESINWMHVFDKKIMEAKGSIIWEFSSSGGRKSNVLDMLKAIPILFLFKTATS